MLLLLLVIIPYRYKLSCLLPRGIMKNSTPIFNRQISMISLGINSLQYSDHLSVIEYLSFDTYRVLFRSKNVSSPINHFSFFQPMYIRFIFLFTFIGLSIDRSLFEQASEREREEEAEKKIVDDY